MADVVESGAVAPPTLHVSSSDLKLYGEAEYETRMVLEVAEETSCLYGDKSNACDC